MVNNKSDLSDQNTLNSFLKYTAFSVNSLTAIDCLAIDQNIFFTEKVALARAYEKTKTEILKFIENPDLGDKCELILSILAKVSEKVMANGQKIFKSFIEALVGALNSEKYGKSGRVKNIISDMANFVGKEPKLFERPALVSVIEIILVRGGESVLGNRSVARLVDFLIKDMDGNGVKEFFSGFLKKFLFFLVF